MAATAVAAAGGVAVLAAVPMAGRRVLTAPAVRAVQAVRIALTDGTIASRASWVAIRLKDARRFLNY